jgi:23S rRNA pseudouridine2605 synthase
MGEGIRLQKYLSQAGRASRREAERLMLAGRVRVNGDVVSTLGTRVVAGRDRVEVDGVPVEVARTRWVAFHKPSGVLTTRSDPHGGRTIYHVLPHEMVALRYVGRLDRDTEGLLLLTNEGDVAHGLQHPSREVEREYRARVEGAVTDTALSRLRAGVQLEDGPARVLRIECVEATTQGSTLSLVIVEGRKREVRRLLYAVGHPVRALRRERFGTVLLGDLPMGASRELTETEIEAMRALARPR